MFCCVVVCTMNIMEIMIFFVKRENEVCIGNSVEDCFRQ
jgi:hypothetical protein